MNLHDYNLVIINSSAGKDSLASIYAICTMAKEQGFPFSQIVVSHQDLGNSEWKGTKELAQRQAEMFGLEIYYSKRRNKAGREETLIEYAERRGKWPSNKQRWCTSDYKRGPGGRVVTALTRDIGNVKVLYVFGFRADESPARKKKEVLKLNKKLTTKKRQVYDYLPIHDWSTAEVWETIKGNGLPYHKAYDLGMPRLSCVFCIFSPFDALVIAGYHNPDLLEQYVQTERKINHDFRDGQKISDVQKAINSGYKPAIIKDWVM